MHEFDTEIVATHYLRKNGYSELFQIKEELVVLPRLETEYHISDLVQFKNIQICQGATCRQMVAIKTMDGYKGIAFGNSGD